MQASNPIKPSHYKNGEHDLLWHLKDLLTIEEFRGAIKMNIIKYTMRYENKNGIEDLEKANQYIKILKEFEQEILDRGNSVNDYSYKFSEEELKELNDLYANKDSLETAIKSIPYDIVGSASGKYLGHVYSTLRSHLSEKGYIDAIAEWWDNKDKETKEAKKND